MFKYPPASEDAHINNMIYNQSLIMQKGLEQLVVPRFALLQITKSDDENVVLNRMSFDDIQNRLFQHKAILNLVEPYLSRTKLYTVMENLGQKVSIDKQILLAYSHIKTHEKQIPINEPLLPLFKRFAFAYERMYYI